MSTVVIKTKLKFKGSTESKSTKKRKSHTEENMPLDSSGNMGQGRTLGTGDKKNTSDQLLHLTEAQLKFEKKRRETELQKNKKVMIETPYRDRIESFNQKLSSVTEHNEIPRISAAGNG